MLQQIKHVTVWRHTEHRYTVGDIQPLKPHQYMQSFKFQAFNSHEVCIYTHIRAHMRVYI